MNIYVVGKNNKVVTVLSDHNCYSATETEDLNGISTLEIELNAESAESALIDKEMYLIFESLNHIWRSYTIKEIADDHGVYNAKILYAEDTSGELAEFLMTSELENVELGPAMLLSTILEGTRWIAGDVETVTAPISIKTQTMNQTKLGAIHLLRSQYKLNFFSRVVVENGVVVGRYVDLKSRRNLRGKRFEIGKDIESVRREVDFSSIKTAILLKGIADENGIRVDMGGVTWTKPANPIDKPYGQLYVENVEATQLYGIPNGAGGYSPRMIYIEDDDYITPEGIIMSAYQRLANYSQPNIRYNLKAVDLFAITGDVDFTHESVNSGDLVIVIDRTMQPALAVESQIIEKVTDLFDPSQTEITLGNARNTFTNNNITVSESFATQIENTKNYIIDSVIEGKLNDAIDNISGHNGGFYKMLLDANGRPYATVWMDNADELLADQYIIINSNGIAFGQNGLQNAPEVTISPLGEVVADKITLGTLNANIIKAGTLQSVDGSSWIDMQNGYFKLGGVSLDATGFKITLSGGQTVEQHTAEAVNAIQIGGRNLILDSSAEFRDISVGTYSGALTPDANIVYFDTCNIVVGETITFRLYLDCTSNVLKGGRARISYYRPDNTYLAVYGNNIEIGERGYSTVSWVVQEGFSRVSLLIGSTATNVVTPEIIQYKEAKLEKGNKATDWSPAPADTDSAIGGLNAQLIDSFADSKIYAESLVNDLEGTVQVVLDTKELAWVYSTIAPTSPLPRMVWVDTSKQPPIPKTYISSTSSWANIVPTTALEIGAYKQADGDNLSASVTQLRQEFDGQGWVSTVINSQEFDSVISGKMESADFASKFTQASGQISIDLSAVTRTVADHDTIVQAVDTSFDFSPTGMRIGKSDSKFAINLDNTQLSFLDGNTVVAYVSGANMYITQANITRALKVGVHEITRHDIDTTIIRWVGDTI